MSTLSTFARIAADGPFQPLAFDPAAFLLTLITFLVLLFILSKLAWKPIVSAAEEREERIEAMLADADEKRRHAEEMLADHSRRVENVEAEMAALREERRGQAESEAKDIVAAARGKAEQAAAAATRDIELARTQALEELRREAVNLSLAVAGKVIERSLDDDDHRRLADGVLAEVGTLDARGS